MKWKTYHLRLAVGIGHPRAFVDASLPAAKWTNSLMMEFLDAMARI
jgi:hypothetical protein